MKQKCMDKMSDPKQAQSQVDKFLEAARELDTNDSEQDFDVLVKRIAKSPPPKDSADGNKSKKD